MTTPLDSGGITASVSLTRVINPCALIEIDGVALLTDPYFTDHRFVPMNEPIGIKPFARPCLDVILGGHGVAQPERTITSSRRRE